MAVERIEAFVEALLAGGRPAETPVAVVQEGTTAVQRRAGAPSRRRPRRCGPTEIRPPAVIVIGAVAGLVDGPVSE